MPARPVTDLYEEPNEKDPPSASVTSAPSVVKLFSDSPHAREPRSPRPVATTSPRTSAVSAPLRYLFLFRLSTFDCQPLDSRLSSYHGTRITKHNPRRRPFEHFIRTVLLSHQSTFDNFHAIVCKSIRAPPRIRPQAPDGRPSCRDYRPLQPPPPFIASKIHTHNSFNIRTYRSADSKQLKTQQNQHLRKFRGRSISHRATSQNGNYAYVRASFLLLPRFFPPSQLSTLDCQPLPIISAPLSALCASALSFLFRLSTFDCQPLPPQNSPRTLSLRSLRTPW